MGVDDRSETVNLKIRQAQLDKIPYMLVVGDKEIAASTVSVRRRRGEKLDLQTFGGFKQDLKAVILSRANEL